MNETLQQFCQRILPIVQAGAEGKEIEAKAEMTGWEIKTFPSFRTSLEYRIAKPKATPLPITPEMWAMIDPKYEWAVLTQGAFGSKAVIFTSDKPEFNGSTWSLVDVVELCSSPLAIDTTGIIPELSLTKRPDETKEKPPIDDDLFTANKFWDKVETIMVKDDLSDKYFFLTTRTNTETGETSTIKLPA